MSARLAAATLDAEWRWAREVQGARVPPPPERVVRGLAAMGTLLRAFCREGDALWLLRAVEPDRVPEVPGLCRPTLVHGDVDVDAYAACLPWAEVPGIARRPNGPEGEVWSAPSVGGCQRDANHRRVGWEIACELGVALPGSTWVNDLAELDCAIAALEERDGPPAPWVLKPAYSAAGRDRVRGRGVGPPGAARDDALRILGQGGGLFEPWLERTGDYGWRGWVGADGVVEPRGGHHLVVDAEGRFKGIALGGVVPGVLEPTALEVGRLLVARGYRGPYTVDAFSYRDGDRVLVHPCCEVNARMSFGWVAAALRAAVAGPLGISEEAVVRLELGRVTESPREDAQRRVALLHPGREDPWGAWLAW